MKNYFPLSKQELMFLACLSSICFSVLKAVNLSLAWSAGIPIFLFVISVIIWAIAKFWQATDWRYDIITSLDGQESRKDIIDAEKSILVTHFSKEFLGRISRDRNSILEIGEKIK